MKSLLFLLGLPFFSAFAGLTWENTGLKLSPKISEETASGVYRFKNATGKSISITDVRSSCGCTTAKLEKTNYAPGESGEITARFDIGGRVGPQHKTIAVTTNDAPESPTVLELSVEILDPLETTAPLLLWKVGAKNDGQLFTVKAKEGNKIKITDFRCSNTFFSAKLESAKDGSVYNIMVTPEKTDAKVFGLLIVTTDYPPNNPRVVYAQLQVQ